MANIINTNGNVGLLKSAVTPVILVDSNGDAINVLTSGSAFLTGNFVQTASNLNASATPIFKQKVATDLQFYSLSGIGNVSLSANSTTVFISGSGGGAGTITGPIASTDNALVLWNGTGGNVIKDSTTITYSNGTLNGTSDLTMNAAAGRNLTLSGLINEMDGTTINLNGITSVNALIGGNNKIAVGSTITTFNQDTRHTSSNLTTSASGTNNIGSSGVPWAAITANQYGTTLMPVNPGGAATTITYNWNNGSSQITSFNPGLSGNVYATFQNPVPGSTYMLQTTQNPSGTTNLYFPSILWQGGVSGVMTASGNAVDVFRFFYNGSNYLGSQSANYR